MVKVQRLLTAVFYGTLVLLASILGCSKAPLNGDEARAVLQTFYDDNVPESITDRHLVRAGKPIVPFLIHEIQRKDMPKRRYAIAAIGKIGDQRALPVLIKIFEDRSEQEYFRGDALEAIWRLERNRAEDLANKHRGESVYVDEISDALKKGRF